VVGVYDSASTTKSIVPKTFVMEAVTGLRHAVTRVGRVKLLPDTVPVRSIRRGFGNFENL